MSLIMASAHALPLVDECVQCCVTSPPYWGLRDYGVPPLVWGGDEACAHEWGDTIAVNATNHTDKRRWNHTRNGRDEEQPIEKRVAWLRTTVSPGSFCQLCGAWFGALGLEPTPDLYVAHLVLVFEEVRRVLKPDGVLWLNLGDSYCSTAPGTQGDPILRRGTFAGVSERRAEASRRFRPETPNGLKPKDLVGVPWMAAFELRAAGWYLRSDVIWSKPNPMPESVTDRPTKAHEYLFLLAKSERYFYDADAIAEPVSASMLAEVDQGYDGLGLKDYDGAGVQNPSSVKARIIANARRKSDAIGANGRNVQVVNSEAERRDEIGTFNNNPKLRTNLTRNKRSVWTVNTQPYPDAHFATFPEALIEPCILAGSRVGDRVLDPFIGTGTVGQAAERLMRRWVGTDLGYQQLAKKRTAQRGLRLDEATA